MKITRRHAGKLVAAALAAPAVMAAAPGPGPELVVNSWYKLVLELVRHTATYSPPVASRAFAYLGIIAYESAATGTPRLLSLAGQVKWLDAVPGRETGKTYDEALVQHGALSYAVAELFANTGPTGQRVIARLRDRLGREAASGVAPEVAARSTALGRAVAAHVLKLAANDGGAIVENLGFPPEYQLGTGPASWVPTSTIALQQKPLLPFWGHNRTFAMPDGAACPLPPPPEYSEDTSSPFYREALEVYDTVRKITPEQRAIARFWSDDPMLSPTPPGHWISIALQIAERDRMDLERTVELLARLGMVLGDAFIACWQSKYVYDLLRPLTYIRRLIDPGWQTVLITPPFPEYPSGHSTQSGAAAVVLTDLLGEDFAFEDATHVRDGIAPRHYASFWEAANEAGISRLYGGIHYRSAIERGLAQGRCVAAHVTALRTRS